MQTRPEVSSPRSANLGSAALARLLHPINLAVPAVAVAFYLLWQHHLIARIPYWTILATVLVAEAASIFAFAAWGEEHTGWRMWALVGVDLSVIGAVVYAIGWGPVFAIALIIGAADIMRRSGSAVMKPAIVFSCLVIGAGQGGIAIGLVPSLIRQPLAQGLAGLEAAALVITVALLGWFAIGRERAEAELVHRERRFSALVTNSADILIVTSAEGELRYTSPAFERLLGYPEAQVQGLTLAEFVHPGDVSSLEAATAAARDSRQVIVQEELRMRRADGEWLWFEAAFTDLVSDPDVNGIVANLRDITGRKDAEERLAHAALHDPLTGLPNRTLILDRAEQMLSRARRAHPYYPAAALFVDLDNFKDINDTLGHEAGDRFLQAVGQRLAGVLRASDTVGRLGGDEFVVLAEGLSVAAGPELVAQRIQDVLREPFRVEGWSGIPLMITASIGIACGDRASAQELLRDADIALYKAKAKGKSRCTLFEPAMQSAVLDRLSLEMDLRGALEAEQFFLVYQPVFDLDKVNICGVEALLRWQHPTRGVVAPDEFIPSLEESGLILEVGRWVLFQACRQAADWHRLGHRLIMSVNVSMRQLESDSFLEDLAEALSSNELDPGALVVEVTETTLMRDTEATIRRLHMLKKIGVLVAIDDFGTGYSSLAYLRQFPVDALKIDRSFVASMHDSAESTALVHTLVQLGRTLGLETLAEGIEEHWQLQNLQREHCERGQGFLFSRPLEPQAIEAFLSEHNALT
jgi:diguanylate cyclase (GGDEF)-like protein/PAS domain S-box-containing protein